jgi:2-keto-3-deoxy-L-rhamnonate aldolase RhmA
VTAVDNKVKRLLREGAVSVGTWLQLNDVLSAEIMARAGFEWLCIDMEHGPVPMETAQAMVAAVRAGGSVPMARIGWNESSLIQTALDIGLYGIIVPMVNSRAEAERVVQDARFPPLGIRSRGGVRASVAFGTDAVTYGKRANDEVLVMVQVETAEALAAADEMAQVEGIDGLFVGPNDVASSMNLWPPRFGEMPREYDEAIASVPRIAKRHGKIAGIQVQDSAFANRCIELGYTHVAVKSDAVVLLQGARAMRNEIKVPVAAS